MNDTRSVAPEQGKQFGSEWVVAQVLDSMRTMEKRLDSKMDATQADIQSYRQEVISQGKVIATVVQRCKDQEDVCDGVHERLDVVEAKVDGLSLLWRRIAGFLAGLVAFLVGLAEAVRWWFEVKQ